MDNSIQKTTLYRYFDSEGQLLYVGITGDNTKRQSQHRRNSFWFGQIASATFEHYDTRELALIAETFAIQHETPLYNIAKSNVYEGAKVRIQLSSKVHFVQMLSEPDNGHDWDHKEWSKIVKSWIEPHYCFDLESDDHFVYHLSSVKFRYDHGLNDKLPNHKNCAACIELFDTEWFQESENRIRETWPEVLRSER